MAVIISPNMNLPVPVVGVEAGPQYATDINNCMSSIDAHNHTPGLGVQIPPAGLNLNSDVTFMGNRALNLKSVVMTSQGSPLAGASPDLGAMYVSGADLFYNDTSGNQIRLTQSGSIVGSSGNISGLVPPASATYVGGNSTFVWQSNVNQAAGMDNGPVTIRDFVTSAKGVTLQSPVSLPADYSITLLSSLPATTQTLTIDPSGNLAANTSVTPSGSIIMYGGASAPSGYLLCDGSAVSRTTYASLFSAIGTNYGIGNGTTTFNVPDLRGLFPRGTDNGAGNDPDASSRTATNSGNSGDNVGSFQSDDFLSHSHPAQPPVPNFMGVGFNGGLGTVAGANATPMSTTGNTGGNETRPKNVYVNFIIQI